jgi:tetratricopeptide (TPR) repeat protein
MAQSLINLSARLAPLGRHKEALDAIGKAVDLYRDLAAARPNVFDFGLSQSLINRAACLSAVGRREEAVIAGDEAVKRSRALPTTGPSAASDLLACSLNELSVCLSEVGRHQEALNAIKEAVMLYRGLAAARPLAFEPDLAMALNNLSLRLLDVQRPQEALPAIEEAVKIRRRLASARPDAYRADLANALYNQSVILWNVGQQEEALVLLEDAVNGFRKLSKDNPNAVDPLLLARALAFLGSSRAEIGQTAIGLARLEEALSILSPSFIALPAAHAPLISKMVWEYARGCRMSGAEPNRALMTPIIEAFQQMQGTLGDADPAEGGRRARKDGCKDGLTADDDAGGGRDRRSHPLPRRGGQEGGQRYRLGRGQESVELAEKQTDTGRSDPGTGRPGSQAGRSGQRPGSGTHFKKSVEGRLTTRCGIDEAVGDAAQAWGHADGNGDRGRQHHSADRWQQ